MAKVTLKVSELLEGRPKRVEIEGKGVLVARVGDAFYAIGDRCSLQDFDAIGACMAEIDGLAFYNGGRAAGASQRHKHLQFVPLPLGPQAAPVPIEPLLGHAWFRRAWGEIILASVLEKEVSDR